MQKFIDVSTQEILNERDVKQRFEPMIINNLDGLGGEQLDSVGVSVVDYIETPAPEVEPWQTLEQGPLDKTVAGVWSTTWIVVSPTVAESLEMRKAAIEQKRDLLRNDPNATVTLDDGRVFQTDPISRDLMNQAKSNADLNGGFAVDAIWRGADNVNYPRTTALFAEISAKEEERQQPIWYLSWALKEEVESIAASELLTDDEKVTAIMSQAWAMPAE